MGDGFECVRGCFQQVKPKRNRAEGNDIAFSQNTLAVDKSIVDPDTSIKTAHGKFAGFAGEAAMRIFRSGKPQTELIF